MEKKNYSIIIAIILITILVIAMICTGCDKKDITHPLNESTTNVSDSGEHNLDIPNVNDNVEWDEEGNKINVSPNINKEKMTFGDIDLMNISCKFADGITIFTANVKNNSGVDYPTGLEMKITFLDKDKNVILETYVMTNTLLANGESNIQAKFLQDCSYADTFDISLVK